LNPTNSPAQAVAIKPMTTVQAELLLDLAQNLRVRLVETDPDEAIRCLQGLADIAKGQVRDAASLRVGRAIDHAARRRPLLEKRHL
jgi:hypothetical protein